MAKAVVSTIAEDRPGLVSELSEVVHSLGLNIEDSRMTVLGGEFAVLMSVEGEDGALEQLQAALERESDAGRFAFLFRRTASRQQAGHQPCTVVVEAMDHPGIVSAVTAFFSERGVNIRELTTETERAAHTGAPFFNLRMTIEVAEAEAVESLQEAFSAFCSGESLDGELIAQ